jgi:SAM-dependent methyltransferase
MTMDEGVQDSVTSSMRRGGSAFDDEDVARAYAYRPPYPQALYDFLFDLTATHRRALDLGCGPGKIAHNLAARFEHVDALDPSLPMLRVADDGRHANITWIHDFAETAPLAPSYQLITAGASIHWMDHALVFPKLAGVLSDGGVLAVLGGDFACDAPWLDEWEAFWQGWLARLGDTYDPGGYEAAMSAFRPRMDIDGERTFEGRVSQPIEHYIECQHSRATWSRANMGVQLAATFDAELREILLPHADPRGMIEYTTEVEVVWGQPRK